ncbi:hypothetical protein CYMTET_48734 [Cymbomonas tetramitiformis]|uniref:Transposase n=1 Tax=Cymbomonas tetramitiformis TaxID=36881 RepID=A0AAE0EUU6_9CHLO|nr:hypothetical protein CYMTET_48734 [Cymbomonas tetramitiformis]
MGESSSEDDTSSDDGGDRNGGDGGSLGGDDDMEGANAEADEILQDHLRKLEEHCARLLIPAANDEDMDNHEVPLFLYFPRVSVRTPTVPVKLGMPLVISHVVDHVDAEKVSTMHRLVIDLLETKSEHNATQSMFDQIFNLMRQTVIGNGDIIGNQRRNGFPTSFKEALSMWKDFALPYHTADVCRNECMIFTPGRHDDLTQCLHCHKLRCPPSSRRNGRLIPGKPYKVFRFWRLDELLPMLYLIPEMAELLVSSKVTTPAENDDLPVVTTFHQSTFWRNKVYVEQPGFFTEPRNISLFMCADGVNPHNDSTAVTSSITPITFQILNLPAEYRAKYEFLLVYGIIEDKLSNAQIYYKFLVDELLDMWNVGVRAFDSRKKEIFQLRCMLTCVVADYGTGGITEIANRVGGNSASKACMFCNITGETWGTSCLNKTIFKELAVPWGVDEDIRSIAIKWYKKSKVDRNWGNVVTKGMEFSASTGEPRRLKAAVGIVFMTCGFMSAIAAWPDALGDLPHPKYSSFVGEFVVVVREIVSNHIISEDGQMLEKQLMLVRGIYASISNEKVAPYTGPQKRRVEVIDWQANTDNLG